ncbi:ester cyclase [Sphingomonas oleivorans]|uniref:ester cyclase n=1 Tax=Sphingomonas oleivorans TaxID=1735121 RepID=UPI001A9DCDB7|nr:ester cyclase [Sphingomonas oleivorans]
MPDLQLIVMQQIVAGDRVVSHLQIRGHFTGHLQGRQGAGQPVDFIATDIVRVQAGRITDQLASGG